MSFGTTIQRINDLAVSDAIRQSASAFPWLESVHVIAICTVVGLIAVVDLRLIGVPAHTQSFRRLEGHTLPIVWGAFAFSLVTGVLMFASNAVRYIKNDDFQIKLLVLLLAFVNMCVFQYVIKRNPAFRDGEARFPIAARVTGAVSLVLWISIVFFGRRIGFTLAPF